ELGYDGLIVATGSTPRTPAGQPPLAGGFTPSPRSDRLDLRTRLDARPRVCVIGAGFIGAEVAATCRGRGLEVTVLEALPQPMVRGVGEVIGAVLARLHAAHGVDLRCGVTVAGIEGTDRVEAVLLADGTRV